MKTRRAFLSSLVGTVITTVDEARGVPYFRLSELPTLPEAQLRQLIPKVVEGRVQALDPGRLLIKHQDPGAEGSEQILDSIEQAVFAEFRGQKSIGQIAGEIADRRGLDPGEAYRLTSTLFLQLARQYACVPVNTV